MKKNSNAFVIIKSLTMSEKRYFKIYSERHTIGEQNKYVVLFDELDKSEVEDDEVLKFNLKKTGINADFISADKNYLYNLILKSLNAFHDSKTFNLELKDMLISIEILFHKGLYYECLKLITKAEKLANECENFQLMIDILTWKKKCSGYSLGLQKAAEVNKAIDEYVIKLQDLKQVIDLYYESNILQSNNEQQSKKEITRAFEDILRKPILKSEKNIISFTGKTFYYLIYANYYNFINNKTKELEFLEKLITLLNASKTYSLENPLDYVSIYNRLLAIKKHFKSDTFFNDIQILKSYSEKIFIRKEIIANRVFIHTHTHELEYYLINNNFNEAIKKLNDIEKQISKTKIEIEPYHEIYFNYLHIITLIFSGNFRKALSFVNKTLNDFKAIDRPQVYLRVEILNAIVHYELKNYSLAYTISKSLNKKAATNNKLTSVEHTLVKAITQISGHKNLTKKIETTLLNEVLIELEKNKAPNFSTLVANYEKWITAKLKKKLVSELFK